MDKRLNIILLFVFIPTITLFAQTNSMVGEIVAKDYYLSEYSNNKGVIEGLKSGITKNTIFFEPAPQPALQYLKNRPNVPDLISWKPVVAKVAKSNEWGFTTGPITSQTIGLKKRFGEYLNIWERDKKGRWKIALRAEIEHPDPSLEQGIAFVNPPDQKFLKQRSEARLNQREDIIQSTDQLMGTVLRAKLEVGYEEFLAPDARLLFSGYSPVLGKENIQKFFKTEKIQLSTKPTDVDRAYSGELAYSYGDAKVIKDNRVVNYYYIRIWEVNDAYKWHVIVEMLFEK